MPDFNGNFGIFIFEIERWSEKVKCRKLSKEFDGIKIFWKILGEFLRKSEKLKNPVLDKMANFSILGTYRRVNV